MPPHSNPPIVGIDQTTFPAREATQLKELINTVRGTNQPGLLDELKSLFGLDEAGMDKINQLLADYRGAVSQQEETVKARQTQLAELDQILVRLKEQLDVQKSSAILRDLDSAAQAKFKTIETIKRLIEKSPEMIPLLNETLEKASLPTRQAIADVQAKSEKMEQNWAAYQNESCKIKREVDALSAHVASLGIDADTIQRETQQHARTQANLQSCREQLSATSMICETKTKNLYEQVRERQSLESRLAEIMEEHEQEVEGHHKTREELFQTKKSLDGKSQKHALTKNLLRDKTVALERQIEQYTQKVEELKALTEEYGQKKVKLTVSEAQVLTELEKRTKTQHALREAQGQTAATQVKLEQCEDDLQKANKTLGLQEEALEEIQNGARTLQSSLEASQDALRAKDNEIDRRNQQLAEQYKLVEKEKKKGRRLDAALARRQDRLTTLKKRGDTCKQVQALLKGRGNALKTILASSRNSIKQFKFKIAGLTRSNTSLLQLLEDAADNCGVKDSSLERMGTLLQEKDAKVQRLTNEKLELATAVACQTQELETKNLEAGETLLKTRELESNIGSQQEELKVVSAQAQSAKNKISELEEQIAAMQKASQQLQAQASKKEESLEQKQKQLREEGVSYQRLVERLNGDNKSIAAELESLQQELHQRNNAFDSLCEKSTRLEETNRLQKLENELTQATVAKIPLYSQLIADCATENHLLPDFDRLVATLTKMAVFEPQLKKMTMETKKITAIEGFTRGDAGLPPLQFCLSVLLSAHQSPCWVKLGDVMWIVEHIGDANEDDLKTCLSLLYGTLNHLHAASEDHITSMEVQLSILYCVQLLLVYVPDSAASLEVMDIFTGIERRFEHNSTLIGTFCQMVKNKDGPLSKNLRENAQIGGTEVTFTHYHFHKDGVNLIVVSDDGAVGLLLPEHHKLLFDAAGDFQLICSQAPVVGDWSSPCLSISDPEVYILTSS